MLLYAIPVTSVATGIASSLNPKNDTYFFWAANLLVVGLRLLRLASLGMVWTSTNGAYVVLCCHVISRHRLGFIGRAKEGSTQGPMNIIGVEA